MKLKKLKTIWSRFLPEIKTEKPFQDKQVILFLLLLVIILAITAGYFQVIYKQERKRYLRLEDRYVRVRNVLGRERTQELIDLSRKNSKNK